MPPLSEWESFYVIVGSSAAALTGLQFVVIALGAESKSLGDESTTSAFATPTIVHFCGVLLVAAIISTPRHTPASLAVCLGACGLAGLSYLVGIAVLDRRQTRYAPVLEDWIWHTALPVVAYASLLVASATLVRHLVSALYVVAGTALLLLFVGIHNAWDAALWLAAKRKEK